MLRNSHLLSLALLVGACNGDEEPIDTDPATEAPCDVDWDSDGYCEGEDCDDKRDLAHPGATEIPYNGKDEDCDGKDLVDVDGDGYDAERAGGDDCMDSNPEVYPGAPEVCYSTIDMNCDGYTSQDDCDGDGFTMRADCNDEDPDINPDAEEVWYDGVDSDCLFDSDFDQDHDGDELVWLDTWPLESWPDDIIVWRKDEPNKFQYIKKEDAKDWWLGLDCNDLEPTIGGNLKELWDGVDRNCDDTIDHLHERDEFSTWNSNAGVGDSAFGSKVTILGDIDGDGINEVAVADVGAAEYAGRITIISADAGTGKGYEIGIAQIDQSADVFGQTMGWGMVGMGDLTGDGKPELAVGNPFYGGDGSGGVHIFDGATLAKGGTLTTDDAHALMQDALLGGAAMANIGDVDGDGLNDLAMSGGWWTYHGAGLDQSISVFSGKDMGAGGLYGTGDALAIINEKVNVNLDFAGGIDITGDGGVDMVYSALKPGGAGGGAGLVCTEGGTGMVYLADGKAIIGGVIKASEDFVGVSGGPCLGYTLGMLDDIDNDGYGEVVIADPGHEGADLNPAGGMVYIIDGDEYIDGGKAEDLAMVTVQAKQGSMWLRVEHHSVDFNNDGVQDLIVGAPGVLDSIHTKLEYIPAAGKGQVDYFDGKTLAAGGTFTNDDGQARILHRTAGAAMGVSWDVGHLDEDGNPDIAIGALQGTGGVFLYGSHLY